jgi:hypothetical protein
VIQGLKASPYAGALRKGTKPLLLLVDKRNQVAAPFFQADEPANGLSVFEVTSVTKNLKILRDLVAHGVVRRVLPFVFLDRGESPKVQH